MLISFLVERSTISYLACGMQLGISDFFGSVEFLLWLPWLMIISRQSATHCFILQNIHTNLYPVGCRTLYRGFTWCLLCHCFLFLFLFFSCEPSRINLFYSVILLLWRNSPVLKSVPLKLFLICSDSVAMITVFVSAVSYSYIFITILKMHSTKSYHKAFSTCTSHLTSVTLCYGTITFIYVTPKSSYFTDQKGNILFYMVGILMSKPLIYSLRNIEIKGALKTQLLKKRFS